MASDGEISCTNDPNFAVIYSFLKVFGNLYGLEIPSITKLHDLIENTQEVLEPLKELHIRLLRRALKSVLTNRWEKSLIKFCHQQGFHQEAWEIERFSYKKASTQVKLKVLKLLLEFQFTCYPKFKNAVNALSCKELRLDHIGRDKNGCVYWMQVDDEANLCLYQEDQDEETWQLLARNREEFVKVIAQLKSGEEVCPLNASNNEDSSSAELPPQLELNKFAPEDDDDNEEFLSPESETDDEFDDLEHKKPEDSKKCDSNNDKTTNNEPTNKTEVSDELNKTEEPTKPEECNDEVGEAIEEPVMVVTGEGNGADCESSYIIGEEITDPVLFIYGDGCGYDNETGNPDLATQSNSHEENSEAETDAEEFVNGEYPTEISNIKSKNKLDKNKKLKCKLPSVTKRSLRKQINDNVEPTKSEPKKHCVRDVKKSIKATKHSNNTDNNTTTEDNINEDNATDSESPSKNNIKKTKGKMKKKVKAEKNPVLKEDKITINNICDTDSSHDKKSSIIEKRKSSLSSENQDDQKKDEEIEKENNDEEKLKADDTLPPKKIRLETTLDSDNSTSHSKETVNKIKISKAENSNVDKSSEENETMVKRKKVKASKNRLKRKKFLINKIDDVKLKKSQEFKDTDKKEKKNCKSLKRSLLNATQSDNKSESQSESEEDEPVSSGKRLKMKPKKIVTTFRKKVEAAKLQIKNSSDESEEETLHSLADKKSSKITHKKKSKSKDKRETDKQESGDETPVRQSRRIAQLKIKEEADRRHLEEVALRELKKIHKKKSKDDEDEWQASASSSASEAKPRKKKTWRASDSTGPEADSDSEEPLFEPEEPDLVFGKSDHEFSPESDLESGEPAEPLKMARTLQGGKDDGFCKRCGSGEQPEWILLCDGCDAGYHASCLKPMLFLIPEGDWFCPPCNHETLIASLENELVKYDELRVKVEEEKAQREEKARLQELEPQKDKEDEGGAGEKERGRSTDNTDSDSSGSSSSSSGSSSGAVYRLRTRRQLPVSYRSQEYDRLISSAIKEEYVEPTTSAGNQGRGKDISTIIEAAEEEKLKAEREAIEQGKPVEIRKLKKKQRRKTRKLNSLDVPSEDDDEIDEDFKDTGLDSSSEEISSSADRESSGSGSGDSRPVRRSARSDKKERPKLRESSPEVKKKKGVFEDSSSDSAAKERKKAKAKSKSRSRRRDKSSPKKPRKRGGLTQYDAEGNVIRARVTYGGLSDDDDNDWSPKHRTRQKKINYTEMPNTESEDEMHKSSGKHMPDSSDEFKVDSEMSSGSESDRARRRKAAEGSEEDRKRALSDLITKTVVVPLQKLPDDVAARHSAESRQLNESEQITPKPMRGRGGRGRGSRGRGNRRVRASSAGGSDDALAKLVGVKIKDLREDGVTPFKPNQAEREKKRLEREAKQAEKEARRIERLQKKEEKEKMKEQKAKEREEKKLARIAMLESKRVKKEIHINPIPIAGFGGPGARPGMRPERPGFGPPDYPEQRFMHAPRLQVRAELRGVMPSPELRLRAESPRNLREGTLSVAGSPQPFKPVSEEPSVITRMPHMMNPQYRGQMMYPPGNPPYGPPRGSPNMMYGMHPGMQGPRQQYPQRYYPPGYPPAISGQAVPMRAPPPRPLGPHPVPITITQSGQIPGNHNQPRIMSPHGDSPPVARNQSPASTASTDEPVKIKTEVKTEPEFNSPPTSPLQRDEPLRNHPKIKHTDNKDRRPRFPLGPYAPQYGPYGPYAPPMTSQPQEVRAPLLSLQLRGPPPNPQNMPQYLPPRHNIPPEQIRGLQRPPGSNERPPHPMMPHDIPQSHLGPYMPQMQQHMRPQMRPHYGIPMMQRPPPGRNSPQRHPLPPPPYHQYQEMHRSADRQMNPIPPTMPQKSPPPRPSEAAKIENHNSIPPVHNLQRVVLPMEPTRNDNHRVSPPPDPSKLNTPVSQSYPKLDIPVSQAYPNPDIPVSQSYTKPDIPVSQPYLKLDTPVSQPYLKVNTSVTQPYPKQDSSVSEPYLKGDSSIPQPYSKVDPAVPHPYLKVDSTVSQPFLKTDDTVNKPNDVSVKLEQIKVEDSQDSMEEAPREEGSVFGGLVSYFSSQHEDDIDA